MRSVFEWMFVTTSQRIERRQAVALGPWLFVANVAAIGEV
jgi:hypothetical protein